MLTPQERDDLAAVVSGRDDGTAAGRLAETQPEALRAVGAEVPVAARARKRVVLGGRLGRRA